MDGESGKGRPREWRLILRGINKKADEDRAKEDQRVEQFHPNRPEIPDDALKALLARAKPKQEF